MNGGFEVLSGVDPVYFVYGVPTIAPRLADVLQRISERLNLSKVDAAKSLNDAYDNRNASSVIADYVAEDEALLALIQSIETHDDRVQAIYDYLEGRIL